jgi:hypothetical protein
MTRNDNNTKGNQMNATKKLTKAEIKLLDRLTKFADTLDIYGAEVRFDDGTVYLICRTHGFDDARFCNVGGTRHPAEWIEARMKAIEAEIA